MLSLGQVNRGGVRKFATIVGAYGVGRSLARRPVEQENDALNFVQPDQVGAFSSHLHGAKEIGAARSKCSAAPRDIESIEPCETELSVQKFVGLVLESAVRTRNDERVRPIDGPFGTRWHLQLGY